MDTKELLGIDCIDIEFGEVNILATISVGPRIISFSYRESGNILAELPGQTLDHPEKGKFSFYGGHRLWIAPEEPLITYLPDDDPVKVNEKPGIVELAEESTTESGIRKTITIQKSDCPNIIIVDHSLMNVSDSAVTIAPWAITQFKLGGKAVLPMQTAICEENPFLPNRALFLWPYTDIQDRRIHFDKQFAFIEPTSEIKDPLKIGVGHNQQWLAYFINDYLFIKYSKKDKLASMLDLGAAGQCYCNNKFVELETLGKYSNVLSGKQVKHREVWRIIEQPFKSLTTNSMLDFLRRDKLANYCQELLI